MTNSSPTGNLPRSIEIDGVRVPRFIYGTAWKEDATRRLTQLALGMGFRGIDTANQRKHYHEAEVGEALGDALARNMLTRDALFVQTKFTHLRGQDKRLPYDPKAPIEDQVRQSLELSLKHLKIDFVDSYLLHGPSLADKLAPADWAAWRAMEDAQKNGQTRLIGISNVSLNHLRELCEGAAVAPRFVQNRCYASRAWDRPIREFCAANTIAYQGFSLLTANRQLARHPKLVAIAKHHGLDMSQIIFRFALDADMIALTGTSNGAHMRADLGVFSQPLTDEEVEVIENIAV